MNNSQDPIKHLLAEHVEIMAEVAKLRTAVSALEEQGDAVLLDVLPVFQQIGSLMKTRLDLHRRKEDDIFFPVMEEMIGVEGPTAVMREEHRDIHANGVLLRETLYELNEVQHPAIEAGGEKLRELTTNGGSASALRATGEEIIHLLDMHFQKEEEILFPMAYQMLEPETLRQVGAQFVQLAAAES
jgi:regulator of cell morphogenesis and NO signaling